MDTSLVIPPELGMVIANNIGAIEERMLSEEQADCPVHHHFYPGIYMREVHIKAGVFSVGHHQKTRHLNIMLKGKVNFIHDDGQSAILEAPMIFMSDPGRKVGLILEDMVWLNVYTTDETDVETLEETYLDKSDNWAKAQTTVDKTEDIEDFHKILEEYNLIAGQVRYESERTEDLIPFPEGPLSVAIFDSPIEGKGLFALANIAEGDLIVHGRIGDKRTPAGRYVNHSKNPNAIPVNGLNGVDFIALRDISGNKGGFTGEEITIDYREAINLER